MKIKIMQLTVMESLLDDAGKGIIRIGSHTMGSMGLKEGDTVSIENSEKIKFSIQGIMKTFAIVGLPYPGDSGMNFVRMDMLTRKNADTAVGNKVNISKARLNPIKKMVIGRVPQVLHLNIDPELIKQSIIGRPLARYDVFSFGEIGPNADQYRLLRDLAPKIEENSPVFQIKSIRFTVWGISPRNGGFVDSDTLVILEDWTNPRNKPQFVKEIEYYMNQFDIKLLASENVEELENLRNKVSKIDVRVRPLAVKAIDRCKVKLMRRIDNKMEKLKKNKKMPIEA